MEDDDFGESSQEETLILNHFESTENAHSEGKLRSQAEVFECLRYAEHSGLYGAKHPHPATAEPPNTVI